MSRLFALFVFLTISSVAQSTQPLVEKITLHDTIQPITAARIDRAIHQAESDHAQALLIDLDTPGGLLDSTRQIVGSILASHVPIIVFIAPDGARAGSAGFFLLEAADIAAMAPNTNAGASHPVLSSGTPDDTMKQKMENDAAAFLRSFTATRGRNVQLAETAVRSSVSWSAAEALSNHLIDLTASDDRDLLNQLDGRTIRHNGSAVTLHTRGTPIQILEPTLRERILSRLANPNLALLLLFAGVLLVYLEFNVPGTIVPGALGTVLILTAIFALDLLPIRHTALLLLLSAFTLIVLELKFPSHGILTAAGIVALAIGTLTLVDAPIPELRIQPIVAIALCACFGVLTALLLRLAIRARRQKVLTGPAALIGSPAIAMEPLGTLDAASIGHILVQGEIWQATATTSISEKEPVRVTGHHGDVLEVEPQPL